ncbi:MAG: hypothetical protein KAI83_02330, partial [Thiomargarita sp.]|nr:hypothetical protein [Thiomargarita sp.]
YAIGKRYNHKDFYRLHANNEHSGIISCTHNKDYQQLAQRIDEKMREVQQLNNQLIRVTRPLL